MNKFDWRNKPITDKQKKLICEMNEFSEFPIPKFTGSNRGDASDYINKYLSKSKEHFDENSDNYGNWD